MVDATSTPGDAPTVRWGTATSAPGTSDDAQGDGIPPAFVLPGQDVGTVSVFERADTGDFQAGYLDDSGEIQQLTDAQLATLLDVTPDGTPETVDLPDLGAYRVRSVTSHSHDTSVIAIPVSAVTTTVDQYIAVEVGAALNRMLGHVESALTARHESETQVRRFVADASHELRTPSRPSAATPS